MLYFPVRALILSASLFGLVLGGCGGGASGGKSAGGAGGAPGAPIYNGPAAPELPAIPRVASDEFQLSPLFADGAVLQRDHPLKVWGQAAPGEAVTVSLGGRSARARAQNDGRWFADLGSFGAGGPFALSAKIEGGQTLTRGNILVGDVWLCSGQSNMELSFESNIKDRAAELSAADYPKIRLLKLPRQAFWSPQREFEAQWQPCRPDTVRPFSAAAYFFGREVHRQTGVAVGLIEAAWASTPAQSWVSADGLQSLGEFRSPVAQNPEIQFLTRLNRWWRETDAGTRANWGRPALDDGAWKAATLPGSWSAAGVTEPVGVIWLRLTVNIPAELDGRDLRWQTGAIGGGATAFWNGAYVGQSVERGKARSYLVPGALVKAGPNVLALRIADGASGGISGEMSVRAAEVNGGGAPLALSGSWKYRVSLAPETLASMPQLSALSVPTSNQVSVDYNGLIAPLQPLGLKGVIWYQGEANVPNAPDASGYERLLTALISDWRNGFENPTLPFYIAQLASYGAPDDDPSDAGWPNLQWAQNRVAARVPNTGLAVLNDVGETDQLHPANKQEVGRRLALLALRNDYGQSVTDSGPVLQSFAVQNDELRLSFSGAEGGLRLQGDADHVFALSDGKSRYAWATPRIEGSEIVLSAPGLSNPRAARFAWSGTPRAALYNGAGLPASLFATDK